MESQILRPPAGSASLWGEGSEKGQWFLPALLSGRKLAPTLSLMPDDLVPPCLSLMPFILLPQCWSSEEVSLSEPVPSGGFKRNCLGLLQLLSSTVSINPHWFLQLEIMESYLPGIGTLG